MQLLSAPMIPGNIIFGFVAYLKTEILVISEPVIHLRYLWYVLLGVICDLLSCYTCFLDTMKSKMRKSLIVCL